MTYTAAPQYIDAAPITTTGGSAAMAQPMMYAPPEYMTYASAPMQYSAPIQYVTADPIQYGGSHDKCSNGVLLCASAVLQRPSAVLYRPIAVFHCSGAVLHCPSAIYDRRNNSGVALSFF